MNMRVMMNKTEVSEALRISTRTVERKVKAGLIPKPSYDLGTRLPRWRSEDIAALIPSWSQQEALSSSR